MKYRETIEASWAKDEPPAAPPKKAAGKGGKRGRGAGGGGGKRKANAVAANDTAGNAAKTPKLVIKFSKDSASSAEKPSDEKSDSNKNNGLDAYAFDNNEELGDGGGTPMVDGHADGAGVEDSLAAKVPKIKIKMQKV